MMKSIFIYLVGVTLPNTIVFISVFYGIRAAAENEFGMFIAYSIITIICHEVGKMVLKRYFD